MIKRDIISLRQKLSQDPSPDLCDTYINLLCEIGNLNSGNILDNLILNSIKHFRAGHSLKALVSTEKALKQSPVFFPAIMIKTEILAENKNLHKLEKLFSCRNLTPSHYGGLIEILLKNNLIVLAEKAVLLGLKKFNSGKKLSQYIRAVIFQRKMDTFFSCKMDALDFKVAVSDIFYRLAELHCQFGNTKKMEFFFKKFSSLETARQKPHQTLNAFCALGEFEKILNLKLMKNYPFKAEEIHDSLNPFEKIIDARHLRFLQKKLNLTSREKPGEPELKFLKALLIKKVSPKKSAEMLSKIKTSNAKLNAIARYHAGQFFLNSVNFKKAHANFQKAFKVFPECETLTGKISECLMGMGSVKKALANIQKLIKKRPSPGLISWRGELLLLSGKYIEAKTILAKATKENRGMSYCWLGAALFKLGKINKALENLNKAVEINPDDLEALIWRAEANIKLNNFEKALRDINKARELDNKFLWVYLNTARICLVKKEFKKAIVEFKKVPLYARKFLIKKSQITLPLNEKNINKPILKAFALAKGNRRDEHYMSAFWMK